MTTLKQMAEEYANNWRKESHEKIWKGIAKGELLIDNYSEAIAKAFLAGAEAVIDELRLRQSRCRTHEAINMYEFVINNLSEWKKDGGEGE